MSQEALDKIKDVTEKATGFKKYFDAIVGVAKAGTTGNIIKVIAVLFISFGFFIIKRIIRKIKIDAAAQLTEKERQELQKYLDEINQNNDDGRVDDLDGDFEG